MRWTLVTHPQSEKVEAYGMEDICPFLILRTQISQLCSLQVIGIIGQEVTMQPPFPAPSRDSHSSLCPVFCWCLLRAPSGEHLGKGLMNGTSLMEEKCVAELVS